MYVHNRDVCDANLCRQPCVECQIFMSERLGGVYDVIVFLLWWDGPVWPTTQVDLLLRSENGSRVFKNGNGKCIYHVFTLWVTVGTLITV